MYKLLILDDDQIRHDGFKRKFPEYELKHTYTAEETIDALKNNEYDYVFLDHDLGGEQMVASGDGTGYEVAEWLANHHCRCPKMAIYIHSLNPIGRKNMVNVMRNIKLKIQEAPCAWM